jgi:hypothetical protein
MSSSGSDQPKPDFSSIRSTAQADAASATGSTDSDLRDRLDKLELALEQISINAQFIEAFTNYCRSMRVDVITLIIMRIVVVALAILMILGFVGLTCFVLFWDWRQFSSISDSVKGTMFVSVVAGSIAILLVLLRGTFRTVGERNKDDIVPDHLKELMDLAKNVAGIGHF